MERNDEDHGPIVDTSNSRDGLLCTLLRLNVRLPSTSLFVLRKKLVRSYLSRSQNYLCITHAEYRSGFRQAAGLSDEEHARVHAEGGLRVRALDRRGVSYRMVLVRLPKTCRLRRGWGEFLRRSGVRQDDDAHVDDVVEIWAFRSPAWHTEFGLVLLHYTKEEDAEITTSLQHEEEEDDGITASSDDSTVSSAGSDQDQDREKNSSPLSSSLDEVVRAAGILTSMK